MIKSNDVVTISYRLCNAKNEELDRSDDSHPFSYLHGHQNIVPGLETALEGLKIGEKKKIIVEPKDGYGEMNPSLKVALERSQFPKDAKLAVGMRFVGQGDSGQKMLFTITDIKSDKVEVDANHPLAGVTLHFDIEVLEIRAATQEELDHGHPHNPDDDCEGGCDSCGGGCDH